jgi:hypothetical protein
MEPRDDRRPDTELPAAGRAGWGPFSPDAWETTRQAAWALLRLCLIMLAAILGYLSVEAIRAIF